LCLKQKVHPSWFELKAFLAQYDAGLTLKDVREGGRVNPQTMLPRDVHAIADMQVEWKCRAKAYEYYRTGCERMIALVAGRPLSSSLDDGTGVLFVDSVVELRRIEQLVNGCDWWIVAAQKKKPPRNQNNRHSRRQRSGAATTATTATTASATTSHHSRNNLLHRQLYCRPRPQFRNTPTCCHPSSSSTFLFLFRFFQFFRFLMQ